MTSTVHLSEIANVLEGNLEARASLDILRSLALNENLVVDAVSRDDCASATGEMEDVRVGFNDAIAHVVMRRNRLREIYSFDKDFDRFADLTRITD